MKNDRIDVVMFNMSRYADWQTGVENRNFHVLHTLLTDARVRKIVAIDYLPFTFKRAVKQWWQDIMFGSLGGKVLSRGLWHKLTALDNKSITTTGYGSAEAEQSEVSYKLFVYSDVSSFWSEKFFLKRLHKQLERLDLKNVVLWSYLPTMVGMYGTSSEICSVFDAVDNWLEHSAYQGYLDRLKINYQIIRYKADLIFTTSPLLVDFFDRAKGCLFVPNGVNVDRINKPLKLVGRDILDLPRPIIGYVGVIQQDRIDIDLIEYVAKQHPSKSLVFIGPVWASLKSIIKARLLPLPNVYFFGYKSSLEMPAYLREFDVAIMPHLVNDFIRSTNPMKIYEYLAAGKPIVATPAEGLNNFKEYIYSAPTPLEFSQAINQAIKENNPELVEKRRAVAAMNTWQNRVDSMMEKIINCLPE
ncbi:glycosyltransferase [Patescibacteria group bacterium]|nr:glycosyltransferase [Patescibacteria group bacterium]